MSTKKCPKCQATFTCCNETSGCWCETIRLEKETLLHLRENYNNCLCKDCLEKFAGEGNRVPGADNL
jgi:hypothetical protein